MVELIYRDAHIVVCLKPGGVLSQEGNGQSMPQLLRQQLQVREVYPIHRLDKAVGGVMVYALTQKAAAAMSHMVQEHSLEKTYLAVLRGVPAEREGQLFDLLFHDKMKNKTYVVKRPRKGVKDAKLSYHVLAESGDRSLVHVTLHTGRTHQIRVQFASRGLPLVGDGRYGGEKNTELALWSYSLRFCHPETGEAMKFAHRPPQTDTWSQLLENIKEI